MAEDSDLEKTEPASPRRLQKAREQGQVARSRELATFLMLVTGAAGLWIGAQAIYRGLSGVIRRGMAFDPRIGGDTAVMMAQAVRQAMDALTVLLPILGALAMAAVLGSIALGGFLISAEALKPQFGRLNPAKGLGRMFSMQTLVELAKAIAKALLVGGIAAWALWHFHDEMLALMHAAPPAGMARGLNLVALCCTVIVASLVAIVLIDAPWQLFSYFKRLRMSHEDVRQEHKESEGDPHVKARIRQQQRAMARRRMMQAVPTADVVVTNPTHYAVALHYAAQSAGAPVVVAKGTGLIAARIREIAQQHKVPLLEAPSLARALHHNVEIGQEIPAALYAAVAEVLAWVFQLRAWRGAPGAEPPPPANLPVPAALDPQHGALHGA